MSKKFCIEVGCNNLIDKQDRFCTSHKKDNADTATDKHYDKNKRNSTNAKFYASTSWKKLRDYHIAKEPMCVMCGKEGNQVDHIIEIEDGGCKLCRDNLQTLCRPCHQFKTSQEKKQRNREVGV